LQGNRRRSLGAGGPAGGIADDPSARRQGVLEATLKGDVDTNLDKRGDIVTKRIDEKMKSAKTDPPT